MPSEQPINANCDFFDGRSARLHTVFAAIHGDHLSITGAGQTRNWPLDDLKITAKPQAGHPIRLKYAGDDGARLNVKPGPLHDELTQRLPWLIKGRKSLAMPKIMTYGVVIILTLLALGYGVLVFAPEKLAFAMPEEWRQNLGEIAEKSIFGGDRLCTDPAGQRALLKLGSKIASGIDTPPDFTIKVIDRGLLNAFALPGGRIILTSKLITSAGSAEEVAGVTAHELGHVIHRDSEAHLIRVMGVQFVLTMATGGSDGGTLGGMANVLTILKFSRLAETKADDFAVKTLTKARINPIGLKQFFQRLMKVTDKDSKDATKNNGVSEYLTFFSTHPGTKQRIDAIKPLPESETTSPLTPQEWQDLRNICHSEIKGKDVPTLQQQDS